MEWDESIASGLLRSLCFSPLLSYESMSPLADRHEAEAYGWAHSWGPQGVTGEESDEDDCMLKVGLSDSSVVPGLRSYVALARRHR
jgi:hypothetical protein